LNREATAARDADAGAGETFASPEKKGASDDVDVDVAAADAATASAPATPPPPSYESVMASDASDASDDSEFERGATTTTTRAASARASSVVVASSSESGSSLSSWWSSTVTQITPHLGTLREKTKETLRPAMERLAIEAKKTGERFLADQFPSDDEYEKEFLKLEALRRETATA
jgi:hypothetical protein